MNLSKQGVYNRREFERTDNVIYGIACCQTIQAFLRDEVPKHEMVRTAKKRYFELKEEEASAT